MGKQVAEYYQSLAVEHCKGKDNFESFRASEVERLKSIGEQKKISKMLQELDKQYKNQKPEYPEDLCFLEGQQMEDYFHDMKICQEYASLNRMVIADRILDAMYKNNIWDYEWNETIHNYYNFEDETMRKGAISAHKDEYGIIPINMRDGSIIFRGKGFSGSLNSAPHGAGRLFGRNEAKRQFNLTDFQDTMFDVYSTSVCEGTLDESPMAYKTMDDILENISEMVDVVDIVKSKYNCKAGGE
jgi:RNA-splicing ligase RtcB